ncbi:MAG: YitT family protein [Bacillales bacterium]
MQNKFIRFLNGKTSKNIIESILLTLIGTFLVAFGYGVFIMPFGIVTGGSSGIAILLTRATGIPLDIWSYIIMWGFYILGVIFLGFKFSLNTLISTILYPIFITIILRTNISVNLFNMLINENMSVSIINNIVTIENIQNMDIGRLLIIALIGGSFVGIGCGITFNGGGSTGGTDTLSFILDKYFNVSTSLSALAIDSSIVIINIIIILSMGVQYRVQFYSALVGLLGAGISSFLIQIFYSGRIKGYVADIITDKYKEINEYVIKYLDRTTTVFKVKGGFNESEHNMVRVCFDYREYLKVKDAIARIDPKAFVIFYNSRTIQGYGFVKLESRQENTITKIKKQVKKTDNKNK